MEHDGSRDERHVGGIRDVRAPGDAHDRRQLFDVADGSRVPVPLMAVMAGYLLIGLALILQRDRFANTPAYANLITILTAPTWGCIYTFAALLMGVSIVLPKVRLLAIVAVTFAMALTVAWLFAFIVRYLTDDGTTVVNVVSWSVFLTILIHWITRLVVQRDDDAS